MAPVEGPQAPAITSPVGIPRWPPTSTHAPWFPKRFAGLQKHPTAAISKEKKLSQSFGTATSWILMVYHDFRIFSPFKHSFLIILCPLPFLTHTHVLPCQRAIKAKISQVAETKNWLPLFSSNVWQNALTESNQRPSTTIKDHFAPAQIMGKPTSSKLPPGDGSYSLYNVYTISGGTMVEHGVAVDHWSFLDDTIY